MTSQQRCDPNWAGFLRSAPRSTRGVASGVASRRLRRADAPRPSRRLSCEPLLRAAAVAIALFLGLLGGDASPGTPTHLCNLIPATSGEAQNPGPAPDHAAWILLADALDWACPCSDCMIKRFECGGYPTIEDDEPVDTGAASSSGAGTHANSAQAGSSSTSADGCASYPRGRRVRFTLDDFDAESLRSEDLGCSAPHDDPSQHLAWDSPPCATSHQLSTRGAVNAAGDDCPAGSSSPTVTGAVAISLTDALPAPAGLNDHPPPQDAPPVEYADYVAAEQRFREACTVWKGTARALAEVAANAQGLTGGESRRHAVTGFCRAAAVAARRCLINLSQAQAKWGKCIKLSRAQAKEVKEASRDSPRAATGPRRHRASGA